MPLTFISSEHLQLGARGRASTWLPAWWREHLGRGAGPPDPCPACHPVAHAAPHRTAGPAQPSPQSRLLLYPFFAPGHGQPAATGRSGSGEYEEMPAQGPGGGHETHFTYAATSGPAVFSVSRGTRLATPLTPEDCRSRFGDSSNMRSWPFGV